MVDQNNYIFRSEERLTRRKKAALCKARNILEGSFAGCIIYYSAEYDPSARMWGVNYEAIRYNGNRVVSRIEFSLSEMHSV